MTANNSADNEQAAREELARLTEDFRSCQVELNGIFKQLGEAIAHNSKQIERLQTKLARFVQKHSHQL